MKKMTSTMSAIILIAVLSAVLPLSSCKKDSQLSNSVKPTDLLEKNSNSSAISGAPLKVDLIPIYTDVEGAHQMYPAMGDNTILFDHTGQAPVLAPDGHQVTLGEFNMASGWADVKCINTGTHVVVHLKGLIPHGVYTIWVMTLKSPGFDGTLMSFGSNLNGVGAWGASDGSQNTLKVNGDGTTDLSVTMPAGPLSVFGSIPNCFGSVYEVLLSGAYHLDGITHGASPGDFSNYVLQFGFPIMGAKL